MPQISRQHPLCVAIMPPKISLPFAASGCCALGLNTISIIPFSRLSASKHLSLSTSAQFLLANARHVTGSFSQATSEDRYMGDGTIHVLPNSKAHTEDVGRTVHIYFVSQQDE
jgi:hypothetical protein